MRRTRACALAELSGHAATPPISAMNSRRLMSASQADPALPTVKHGSTRAATSTDTGVGGVRIVGEGQEPGLKR